MFGSLNKNLYFCKRYPEYNLFTLKKLIPIEDLERSTVKLIAFFYAPTFLIFLFANPFVIASMRTETSKAMTKKIR